MKIAIIRKKYTFHGGSESFSQQLIQHLAEAGHNIHIFASKWDSGERPKNIHFHKIPVIKLNSTLRDLSFALFACYALKGKNYDIIQTHDKTLYQDIYRAGDGCHIEWLSQRWKRIGLLGKVSITLNPYHWLILALERSIFRRHRFKRIIAISELVKNNIMKHYDVNEADIEVIYNGVDLKRFHPDNVTLYRTRIREEYAIPESETVALFVGSGFERKGVRFILEALNMVEEPLTVLVVGKGSEITFSDKYGNKRVIFCGPKQDIQMYYAAADFFVFPTIYEPFGNVHLEALASGLPVITSKLSGASEIIENGKDGFVIPSPEDTVRIAEAMSNLTDRTLRSEMSENARNKAEAFPFSRHIEETINLYNSLSGNRNAAS
jgi:UDP-glucose:(heptosyl)LPS alpha-1,3-glucosyltransferase